MLDLLLENNNFSSNDKHYIQREGTAIGLHFGMNYACTCTLLGDWKKELLQKSEYLPAQYWRYVDDIWGIWEHGLDKRHQFPNLANSLHPRIKLELRFSNEQIECQRFN